MSAQAVTLLIAASQLHSYSARWLKGGREGESKDKEQERKKERGLFLHSTQQMSGVLTPLTALGESQKKKGESQGCLSTQRSQLYN